MRIIGILLLFIIHTSVQAQLNPVQWQFRTEKAEGNAIKVICQGTIQNGWYIYSQFLKSDDGPVRTSIVCDEGGGSIQSTLEDGDKIEGYDAIFEMDVIKFKKHATFTAIVQPKPGMKAIKGYIEYMCCDSEQCLPPKQIPFSLTW